MQKLVKDFLILNKGYLKKSPYKIAERLHIKITDNTIEQIRSIIKEVKNSSKIDNIKIKYHHVIPNTFVPNKDYLTKLALESFMENGNYDKAIDFINKIKQEEINPKYKISSYKEGNYIVLGCLHFPFVNKEFFSSVIDLIKDCPNLEGIILAGDILDMSSISRHNKGLMPVLGYDLAREYKEANVSFISYITFLKFISIIYY